MSAATLHEAFARCLDLAVSKFPAFAPFRNNVHLSIVPNMGRAAGNASIIAGKGIVKLNYTIAVQNMKDMIGDTIPHEIAHIVCGMLKIGRNHDATWKRVARTLGSSGERCYNARELGVTVVKLRQRTRYLHRATCGTEVWVTDVMHNKIMSGSVRILRGTNGRLDRTTSLNRTKVA